MTRSEFERLKYIKINELYIDCPVDIEKGALILDKNKNKVLLQLKLLNISSYEISSIHISVETFDNAKDAILGIEPIKHDYLNLKLNQGENTGVKQPVILDKLVRDVKVRIEKVVFESGDIWRSTSKEIFYKPEQENLKNIGPKRFSHLTHILRESGIDSSKFEYYPIKREDAWICSCGRPNYNSLNDCARCGINKASLFDIINTNSIDKSLKEYQEDKQRQFELEERNEIERKAADDKRIKQREDERILENKKRKRTLNVILILLTPIVIYFVFSSISSSNERTKYLAIHEKLISSDFTGALQELEVLKLENSGNNNIKFDVAKILYENKYFFEAKKILETIPNSNSKQLLNSSYYKIEGKWKNSENNQTIEIKLEPNAKVSMGTELYWSETKDFTFQATTFGNYYKIISVDDSSGGSLVLEVEDHYGKFEERVYVFVGSDNQASSQVEETGNTNSSESPNSTESFTPEQPSKDTLSSSEVYYWIQDRYEYYDDKYNNGEYSGDEYTKEVFADAAAYFRTSITDVRKAYDAFRY